MNKLQKFLLAVVLSVVFIAVITFLVSFKMAVVLAMIGCLILFAISKAIPFFRKLNSGFIEERDRMWILHVGNKTPEHVD